MEARYMAGTVCHGRVDRGPVPHPQMWSRTSRQRPRSDGPTRAIGCASGSGRYSSQGPIPRRWCGMNSLPPEILNARAQFVGRLIVGVTAAATLGVLLALVLK